MGQADAALMECDGEYALIDGGNPEASSKIYSILKEQGIKHLTLMVATHGHSDHCGGLSGALNYATAETILCPVTDYDSSTFRSFVKYANKTGKITVPKPGDTFTLGSAKLHILGVNSASEDHNDTSIVLKVTYGDTAFLFTGDAERPAEQVILDAGFDLSSTVLKVGHHGSSNSTTYPFLREIMPEYAVISVGADNEYGHPTDAVLSRLKDADIKVFRTDLHGDIFCTSDGEKVTFITEKSSEDAMDAPVGSDSKNEEGSSILGPSGSTDSEIGNYVLNTNTKKFHFPSCSSAADISKKNRKDVNLTREEILSAGYNPCGRCHP